MAVPRPILLAVLGLLLVFATLMATMNAHKATEASSSASKPVAVKSDPKPQHKAKQPADKAKHPAPKPAEKHATSSVRDTHKQQPRAHHHAAGSTSAAVKKDVGAGHVVVLAFFQKRGADDRATRTAVNDLKRRHLARVYMDIIDHIGRFGPVVGSLGITQAPAIVIIDKKRHARLVEGYVDPESLAQEVSDARK